MQILESRRPTLRECEQFRSLTKYTSKLASNVHEHVYVQRQRLIGSRNKHAIYAILLVFF